MKIKFIIVFCVLFIISLSLGCVEHTNQLSSDFTSIGTNTFFVVNDSNILLFHTCEQQNVNFNLQDKYIIRGNITNIGQKTIYFCELNASFFTKNSVVPKFVNNDVDDLKIILIEPNKTLEFTIEKYYNYLIDIRSYKIYVSY